MAWAEGMPLGSDWTAERGVGFPPTTLLEAFHHSQSAAIQDLYERSAWPSSIGWRLPYALGTWPGGQLGAFGRSGCYLDNIRRYEEWFGEHCITLFEVRFPAAEAVLLFLPPRTHQPQEQHQPARILQARAFFAMLPPLTCIPCHPAHLISPHAVDGAGAKPGHCRLTDAGLAPSGGVCRCWAQTVVEGTSSQRQSRRGRQFRCVRSLQENPGQLFQGQERGTICIHGP